MRKRPSSLPLPVRCACDREIGFYWFKGKGGDTCPKCFDRELRKKQ